MINIYLYPIIVLLSLIFIFLGTSMAIRFAPTKIKIFSILIFLLLSLRYLTLVIFILSKNIRLLYLLKPLVFINYLCIPMAALVTIYISMRNEKFKFANIFTIFTIFTILYFTMIYLLSSRIELSYYYGYRMYLIKSEIADFVLVLLNTFYLTLGIKLLYRNGLDKKGISLIIFASLMAIIEIVIPIGWKSLLQENVISDFFWIITYLYSLNKLKSRI